VVDALDLLGWADSWGYSGVADLQEFYLAEESGLNAYDGNYPQINTNEHKFLGSWER